MTISEKCKVHSFCTKYIQVIQIAKASLHPNDFWHRLRKADNFIQALQKYLKNTVAVHKKVPWFNVSMQNTS